jgi:hypothetical protein
METPKKRKLDAGATPTNATFLYNEALHTGAVE